VAVDGPSGSGKSSASKGVARALGLRYLDTGAMYSAVAVVPEVRRHLISLQRAIIAAAQPGIVAEGRDIGTVVAPDAQLKVFLTAHSQARAKRRAAEQGAAVDVTEADQDRRDRLDAAQSAKAADAVLLDATDLTLPEVIGAITRLARERAPLARAGGESS